MAMKTIGVVGGGQLGRMLTLAALPLGFRVVVVDPGVGSPAAQVGAAEITANLYDESALRQLAEQADVITVEIEHLDTDVLAAIEKLGTPVHPSPATIKLIQDKLKQKEFLAAADVPVAEFVEISSPKQAVATLKKFGGKMLLKARHGAYDGRGNRLVSSPAELKKALAEFKNAKLYAEKFVPFVKELAIMVARGTDGSVALYPVVETIHERNICLETIAPAEVSDEVVAQARDLATRVAKLLDGAGVFGIEMFLTVDGKVLVNEIAPRVHNSGHYTIEGCVTSQFEQHIRAISGLPLGSTAMQAPAAVMINILGERDGPTEVTGLNEALKIPHVSVHVYGKSPTKVDRKMGHITATADTIKTARQRARKARRKVSI